MAFDPAIHTIDPVSGFMVHKFLGHRIGLDAEPVASIVTEYPKWVPVHVSHLEGSIAPEFGETFRNRDGEYTVLVHDEDEEGRAKAEVERKSDAPEPELEPPHVEPHTEPEAHLASPEPFEPAPMPEHIPVEPHMEPVPGFPAEHHEYEHND